MLFRQILRFWKLHVVALWLDMLRKFLLTLFLTICHDVMCEDYFQQATQRGLDYVRQIGIPFLESELQKISIPTISGSTKTPLSDFSYELSSIKIIGLSIRTSNLTIDQQTGLSLSFQKCDFHASSKWHYRERNWPHVKDSGDVNINAKDASLQMVVSLDVHNEKHPKVHTKQCALTIGTLKLNFHGGASWLYNIFSDKIAGDLKKMVAGEVCHAIMRVLENEGERLLSQAPNIISTIKSHIMANKK